MQKIFTVLLSASILVLAGCGAASKQNDAIDKKKKEVEELKQQKAGLEDKIAKLETEIAAVDSNVAKTLNTKLVTLTELAPTSFTHYLDLQGNITSDNIVTVTPRNQGGQVIGVYVKQGDQVKKGQLLLRLNDDLIRRSIDQARVQLDYQRDILSRREKLWSQGIGAEVDLITARTQVQNAEKQLAILNQQLQENNIYAPITGVADVVNVRVGEFFSPQSVDAIRIVNNNNLKVEAKVPENYLSKIRVGTPVQIVFPDVNKTVSSKVSVSGKQIDPASRSFNIEAKLTGDGSFRPNQLALVKIQDYTTGNAITIPVNTLQTDDKGKFVLVAVNENGKLTARKRSVTVGELYGDKLEVKSGLQAGDKLITNGFQNVYDGQLLTTGTNS